MVTASRGCRAIIVSKSGHRLEVWRDRQRMYSFVVTCGSSVGEDGDGTRYNVALEYNANVDSLMRVFLEVTTGENGNFSAENSFPETEKKEKSGT